MNIYETYGKLMVEQEILSGRIRAVKELINQELSAPHPSPCPNDGTQVEVPTVK
jgi:hypothetical protein